MQGVESDKKPKGGRHQHVVMYIWTWIKVGWDEGEREEYIKRADHFLQFQPTTYLFAHTYTHATFLPTNKKPIQIILCFDISLHHTMTMVMSQAKDS